ncbi:cache domain-containing protein, partial [Burkholderia pseudomallei]
ASLSSKEIEPKHYGDLATSALAPLYEAGRANARDDAQLRLQALAKLPRREFGPHGYFCVYDQHGKALMHPREPERGGDQSGPLRAPRGSPAR